MSIYNKVLNCTEELAELQDFIQNLNIELNESVSDIEHAIQYINENEEQVAELLYAVSILKNISKDLVKY